MRDQRLLIMEQNPDLKKSRIIPFSRVYMAHTDGKTHLTSKGPIYSPIYGGKLELKLDENLPSFIFPNSSDKYIDGVVKEAKKLNIPVISAIK